MMNPELKSLMKAKGLALAEAFAEGMRMKLRQDAEMNDRQAFDRIAELVDGVLNSGTSESHNRLVGDGVLNAIYSLCYQNNTTDCPTDCCNETTACEPPPEPIRYCVLSTDSTKEFLCPVNRREDANQEIENLYGNWTCEGGGFVMKPDWLIEIDGHLTFEEPRINGERI